MKPPMASLYPLILWHKQSVVNAVVDLQVSDEQKASRCNQPTLQSSFSASPDYHVSASAAGWRPRISTLRCSRNTGATLQAQRDRFTSSDVLISRKHAGTRKDQMVAAAAFPPPNLFMQTSLTWDYWQQITRHIPLALQGRCLFSRQRAVMSLYL